MRFATMPDFPCYRIYENGEVRTCITRMRCTDRVAFDYVMGSEWKPMSPSTDSDGYQRITLRDVRGKKCFFRINRLVLLAFVAGPPPAGAQACHGDGNKNNNCLSNLRWGTAKENIADKKKHGTHRSGESHPGAVLTYEKADAMRVKYAAGGVTYHDLAAEYGVSKSTVGNVIQGLKY